MMYVGLYCVTCDRVWRNRRRYCRKAAWHHTTIMSHYANTFTPNPSKCWPVIWLSLPRNRPRNRPRNVRFRFRFFRFEKKTTGADRLFGEKPKNWPTPFKNFPFSLHSTDGMWDRYIVVLPLPSNKRERLSDRKAVVTRGGLKGIYEGLKYIVDWRNLSKYELF